ncbi:hypothetical protein DRO97_06015 [Archaeoglobales archaeon]|nr:MAG: hypothetical protein DRO97_06015 [Archaeoglobales archaeon]
MDVKDKYKKQNKTKGGLKDNLNEAFQLLINNIKDYAIFMLNPEGYIVSWNKGAERIKGYKADEVIGKHFSIFYTKDDVKKGKPEMELKIAEKKGRYEEEGVRVKKDGSKFFADVVITSFKDEEGNLVGFVKIVRDVTERKKMEEELKQKEELFHALVENAMDIVMVVDREGRIKYISQSVERIAGYTPQEFIGKNALELVHPDDHKFVLKNLTYLVDNLGVSKRIEFRIRAKDGSWRYVEAIGNNLTHIPAVDGIVVNFRDVTERKVVEERLKESEETYRTLFEAATDAIFLLKDDILVDCNIRTLEMFRCRKEDIIGKTPYDFSPTKQPNGKDSKSAAIEKIKAALNGNPQLFEWKHRRLDGTLFDAEINLSRIKIGGEFYLLAIVRDVTMRKRAEEEKERMRKVLQSLWKLASVDVDYRTLYNLALNEIIHLTESKYGFFGTIDEGETELTILSWSKDIMKDCRIWSKSRSFLINKAGIWAEAIRKKKTIIINDYLSYPNKKGFPDGHVPLTRLLVVPIFEGKKIVSLTAVANKPTEYTEEDAELIKTFMTNVQLILDKKRIEELYRSVIETTGTAIIISDEKTTIIYVNKEVEKLLGLPKEEIVGKSWTEFVVKEELDKMLEYHKLRSIDPSLAPKSYETKLVDKKGDIKHVLLALSVIPDTNNHVISFLDVTELRKAERKIKESEERYRTLFEKSKDAIVLTGMDMRVIDCNESALKLVGMTKEEIVGKSFIELGIIDEKDISRLMETLYKAMREEVGNVEVNIKVGDEIKWLEVSPTVLEKDGKPYTLLIIIRDVTERKKYEEKIKLTFERLRIIHELDKGIIAGKTFREIAITALKNIREFVECEGGALLTYNTEMDEFVLITDADKVIFKEGTTIASNRIRSFEKVKRGEIVGVENILELDELTEIEKELLKAGMRSHIHIPLIVRDEFIGILCLTSKKPKGFDEKIDFMKEISDQLAIALHEARLSEMRKKAIEQIDHNIEQLAILVDHIRNPLASIVALAEMHVEDKEIADKILKQAERIEDVIEKLDKSWLESDKVREFLKRSYKD